MLIERIDPGESPSPIQDNLIEITYSVWILVELAIRVVGK